MPVRTKQLYLGQPTNGAYTILYTCPSGARTIIRSVVIFEQSSPGHEFYLYMRHLSGGGLRSLRRVTSTANQTQYLYDVWSVMEAGDQLVIYTNSADLSVVASGAELSL